MSSVKIFLLLSAMALLLAFRKRIAADWRFFHENRREWLQDKWENWIKPLVVAAVLAIFIRTFLVGPYKIPTGSMHPVFLEGDRIFVDKITYRFREPERGEILVFKYPLDRRKDFVKRLVARGGETAEIRDGQIYINGERLETPASIAHVYYYNRDDWPYGKRGQRMEVPEGHYFTLGDNSAQSSDSRNWGFVARKDVVGRAVLIWWPPHRIRIIRNE